MTTENMTGSSRSNPADQMGNTSGSPADLRTLSEVDVQLHGQRKDINLPGDFQNEKLAFIVDNVFSKEECEELIRQTEEQGYEVAMLNVGGGRQILATDYRNSERCIMDSAERAEQIWERIKQYVPRRWARRKVLGLNERLRFLKYGPGNYFHPHMDGSYRRENGERSYLTLMLYLNEGSTGGATNFISPMFATGDKIKEKVPVIPKPGRVLVFQHDIYHEGEEVTAGVKYAMRTDVMYGAEPVQEEEEEEKE
ncbi:uncharacterized protein LOC144865702 [Branchiostoma floridae x Branchiostoma japonicum]